MTLRTFQRLWSLTQSAAEKNKGVRPVVKLLDEQGNEVKVHGTGIPLRCCSGRFCYFGDGWTAGGCGDVLARIPQNLPRRVTDIPGACPVLLNCLRYRTSEGRVNLG